MPGKKLQEDQSSKINDNTFSRTLSVAWNAAWICTAAVLSIGHALPNFRQLSRRGSTSNPLTASNVAMAAVGALILGPEGAVAPPTPAPPPPPPLSNTPTQTKSRSGSDSATDGTETATHAGSETGSGPATKSKTDPLSPTHSKPVTESETDPLSPTHSKPATKSETDPQSPTHSKPETGTGSATASRPATGSRSATGTPSVPQTATDEPVPTPSATRSDNGSGSRSEQMTRSSLSRGTLSYERTLSGSAQVSPSATGRGTPSPADSHSDSCSATDTTQGSASPSQSRRVTSSHSLSLQDPSVSPTVQSPSRTLIDNPDTPISQPIELVIDKKTAKAVINGAITSTMITSIVHPTVANKANNVLRITSLAVYCANTNNLGELNPIKFIPGLPITLGSDDPETKTINGAIVSTTGFMAATLVAFLLTGYFRDGDERPKTAKAHEFLSQALAFAMSYYGPNVIEIATLSAGHFTPGDKGLAIPSMGLWTAAFSWLAYKVYQQPSADDVTTFSFAPFYDPTKDFTRMPVRALVLVDMLEAYILSVLSGVKPNPSSCKTVAGLMLAVSSLALAYVAGLRPYESKIEQGLVTGNSLLLVIISGLNLATIYDNKHFETLGRAEFAALCYAYLQMAVMLGLEVKKRYDKYKEKQANADVNLNTSRFNIGHQDSSDIDVVSLLEFLAGVGNEKDNADEEQSRLTDRGPAYRAVTVADEAQPQLPGSGSADSIELEVDEQQRQSPASQQRQELGETEQEELRQPLAQCPSKSSADTISLTDSKQAAEQHGDLCLTPLYRSLAAADDGDDGPHTVGGELQLDDAGEGNADNPLVHSTKRQALLSG